MNDYTVKEVDSDVREFASLLNETTIKENNILPATPGANLLFKNIPLCDGIHLSVCVLVLLFVALWLILVLCLPLCYFVLVFFSPFSIAINSFQEERANLSAFRTFVRFVLV